MHFELVVYVDLVYFLQFYLISLLQLGQDVLNMKQNYTFERLLLSVYGEYRRSIQLISTVLVFGNTLPSFVPFFFFRFRYFRIAISRNINKMKCIINNIKI